MAARRRRRPYPKPISPDPEPDEEVEPTPNTVERLRIENQLDHPIRVELKADSVTVDLAAHEERTVDSAVVYIEKIVVKPQ